MSKKCDELRQLFMLQKQSNNNNHEDNMSSAVASPTSSSPPASTSLTSRMNNLRKQNPADHDEEDSNSSLIVNHFSEDSSLVNLCFSKEIETLRSQLKTQVRIFGDLKISGTWWVTLHDINLGQGQGHHSCTLSGLS